MGFHRFGRRGREDHVVQDNSWGQVRCAIRLRCNAMPCTHKPVDAPSFKEANLEKLTAERKKLFPFHSDFAKDHDVVESRKDQKDKHTQGVCCLALNG